MSDLTAAREALFLPKIPARADAVRAFGASGSWEDIAVLVPIALGDRAASVRLGAATACADILARSWLREGPLTRDATSALATLLRCVEPGRNPAMLQVDAELGTPEGRRRVAAGLRDRRFEVRVGARVALARVALSLRSLQDPWARDILLEALGDRRLHLDLRAELCRLAARADWPEAQAHAEQLLSDTETISAEAAAWAVRIILAPPSVAGVWTDRGGDVYAEGDGAPTLFGLRDGGGFVAWSGAGAPSRVTLAERPRRLMVRVGAADVPALQIVDPAAPRGARMLWPATTPERATFLTTLLEQAPELFAWLEDSLPHDEVTVAARLAREAQRKPAGRSRGKKAGGVAGGG
jgi:hypothetical protein